MKNRDDYPMFDGLLAYFPAALAEVARCSKVGNDQHNPGQPLHWARAKSTDHANKIIRHLLEHGKIDTDGVPHSAKVAWRALALLQEEMEARGGVSSINADFRALVAEAQAQIERLPSGGGHQSHYLDPPEDGSWLDRVSPTEGLNFDKAIYPDSYAAATAGQRETGE